MPREKKLRRDVNETAFDVAQGALGEADKPQPPGSGKKNPEAVRRGRKGGLKGGGGRAKKLTKAERSAIAKKGGMARASKISAARRGETAPEAVPVPSKSSTGSE